MGKKVEQNRLTTGLNGVQLEQNTAYEDNLLPSADELEKLNRIDQDIIPWIMRRTEVEQDGRIDFNKKRLGLASKEINFAGWSTIIGIIICAFVIVVVFYLSYKLIKDGHEAAGIAFGGADVVGMLMVISKFQFRKRN